MSAPSGEPAAPEAGVAAGAAASGRGSYPFSCSICGFGCTADYKGPTPPGSRILCAAISLLPFFLQTRLPRRARPSSLTLLHLSPDSFLEPTALFRRDPFVAARKRPLLLGAECSVCARLVCTAASCSLFYSRRFCTDCAAKHRAAFPPEVQPDIAKAQKLRAALDASDPGG